MPFKSTMTKEQERELVEVIAGFQKEGVRPREIVGRLNEKGLKTATGMTWTLWAVYSFLKTRRRKLLAQGGGQRINAPYRRKRVSRPASVSPTPKTQGTVQVIASLYTDPHLSDAQFRRMVGAYLNER